MKVQVRFFATLTDLTGRREDEVELSAPATVSSLWEELGRRYPALGDLDYRPMVACDLEYARWESSLEGVREVAFLPPVSGG
ncbi:hypothetical protein ABI59_05090 [Acidobacteria bacterium Mor1]|nr:hypothetical protein ABI59_05090 [Acidobacteria bacterium Mor1]